MKLTATIPILSTILLATTTAQSYTELKPNFLENGSKKFAFVGLMGGSSHFNWVLSIGDELGERGHDFVFISSDEDARYAKPYANVKSDTYGPGSFYDRSKAARFFETERGDPFVLIGALMDVLYQNLERDYAFVKQYFIDNHIDVAICDHFADSCVDAANNLSIPHIVSGSLDLSDESSAPYLNTNLLSMKQPTTEFQSVTTRFKNMFVSPLTAMYRFYPIMKGIIERKKAIGIPAKMGKKGHESKYSLKLVNNLNGYIPARPVGALAELVGPVLATKYAPLTRELEDYLTAHNNVAYIAFGEKATPNQEQVTLLLTALLENMERDKLDGFIWATIDASSEFPDSITTSSNTTYNIKDMFDNKNPHVRLMKYTPQTAILINPSTKLFISHGGLTSWYESMYAGTPMILLPFFGDQHANAFMIVQNNLGGLLEKDTTIDQATELFGNVLDDKDGKIRDGVLRYQAMTQIHSRRGVHRGADLLEEVAYTNINGRLPHRESADKHMSYIKAHNIDLFGLLALILLSGFSMIVVAVKQVYRYSTKKSAVKTKTL